MITQKRTIRADRLSGRKVGHPDQPSAQILSGTITGDSIMRGNHNNHAKASRTGRWNEKKMLSPHGYVKLRVGASHPLADANGYVYEHIVIWVAAGNSRPTSGTVLHHINHTRTDNRIENLEMLTIKEHNKLHNKNKIRNAKGQFEKKAGCLLDGKEWKQYPKETK